jgi:hypothetical protein
MRVHHEHDEIAEVRGAIEGGLPMRLDQCRRRGLGLQIVGPIDVTPHERQGHDPLRKPPRHPSLVQTRVVREPEVAEQSDGVRTALTAGRAEPDGPLSRGC